MTAWSNQSFWSKAGGIACLALLMVIPGASDAGWMGGGSPNRNRVFSPGFIVLCAFVAVFELLALNHFYAGLD